MAERESWAAKVGRAIGCDEGRERRTQVVVTLPFPRCGVAGQRLVVWLADTETLCNLSVFNGALYGRGQPDATVTRVRKNMDMDNAKLAAAESCGEANHLTAIRRQLRGFRFVDSTELSRSG